ncbi:MAG TPA: trypsin-like peptidase domain-containing protein [Capsulimonadaceae bacterium]|jgi:serine protease Do
MRKFTSYALTFVVGFLICVLAVSLSRGAAPFNLSGEQGKNVVLAKLQSPVSAHDRVGSESVITKAASVIEPSIVTIDVESKPMAQPVNPFAGDPFFRRFFGEQNVQPRRSKGVGSGVIISEDGYIITNNHVVANADTVKVMLSNGKGYRAKVIGADTTSDIAVVKIEAPTEKLVAAQLGDSKSLRVGDMVIAAGNPLNIGTTVTFGIVSALGHRNSEVTGPTSMANDIIQTDAAINPGNSGGALADMEGRVVGINEAIISPNGSFIGIGLAIPISTAKDIAYQLIKSGRVVRPYVGIGYVPIKTVPEADRAKVGITTKGDTGVVVTNVYANSPAAGANLRLYDVILDANGVALDDSHPLQAEIAKLPVGGSLVLRIARGSETKLVTIKVGEMPKDFGAARQEQDQDPGDGQMP